MAARRLDAARPVFGGRATRRGLGSSSVPSSNSSGTSPSSSSTSSSMVGPLCSRAGSLSSISGRQQQPSLASPAQQQPRRRAAG
ncbi:hypothetical protein MNEG_10110, partial [Monoraphidium neglectum]